MPAIYNNKWITNTKIASIINPMKGENLYD